MTSRNSIKDIEKTPASAKTQSSEASDEDIGMVIYFGGALLAVMIALAKGSSLIGALGYGILSWLYVIYSIVTLVFG